MVKHQKYYNKVHKDVANMAEEVDIYSRITVLLEGSMSFKRANRQRNKIYKKALSNTSKLKGSRKKAAINRVDTKINKVYKAIHNHPRAKEKADIGLDRFLSGKRAS